MASTTGQLVSLVLISLILLASLVLNIFLLVVMCKRRKLKKPYLYPVFSLVIVDLLASCAWTSLTVWFVAGTNSFFPLGICRGQSFFATLYSLVSWHGLCLLGLERLARIWRPFNHAVVFSTAIVLLLILGVWMVGGVLSIFSVAIWASSDYYPGQYQCAPNFRVSYSFLNFLFIFTIIIPVIVLIVCFALSLWRIRVQRQRQLAPSGAITLQGKDGLVLEPYGVRVLQQGQRFQNVGMKTKKPRTQHVQYTNQGYVSGSDSSSEEEVVVPSYGKVQSSVHHLAKSDFDLLKTYAIAACLHLCLWLPFFAVRYTWTFSVYAPIDDAVWTVVVWLAHASTFVRPVVYLCHNPTFRSGLKKTCCRKSQRKP